MFSLTSMPSTNTLFSAYASAAASLMLVRSIANDLIPYQLQGYVFSGLRYLFSPLSSQLTLIIEEFDGLIRNEIYEASQTFLGTKINPSVQRLKVVKAPRENISVTIEKDEEVSDEFEGIHLRWRFVCSESQKPNPDDSYMPPVRTQHRYFELRFHKKHKDKVVSEYLPHVLNRAKAVKAENKVVKLHTLGNFYGDMSSGGVWGSINLEHPATFDTLAMDPEAKRELIEDLDRFVKRKEFYKRVGKAWKRGYLLYGPPGTGKSSLIAAMANYLKFDVYDLELANLQSDSELRRLLVATANRSILVIEDIDCSTDLESQDLGYDVPQARMTLSGLLNFIDGLWSSCGDERIIVFTTNHKDRLDPALLRPGRMDKHIHMSYCTAQGFKLLASNYLGIDGERRDFEEIEDLIEKAQVTPAEVAEELMTSDDAEASLDGLVRFLKRKKMETNEPKDETEPEAKRQKIENEIDNSVEYLNGRSHFIRGRGRRRRGSVRRMRR